MRKFASLFAMFLLVTAFAFGQNRNILGVVVDDEGTPVSGASVRVKGTNTGVATDNEGKFTISAKTGDVLVVSGASIETTEATVGSSSSIQISVRSSVVTEEEVTISTGYTRVNRKNYSGATVALRAEKIAKQPLGSFDQALQGAGAGISVVSNTGQPGTNAVVRIRGYGSISGGNVPLYVLDGIEITAADFASLNQGDFETIDILKDAVATGQFGSRGANGVVIITSKKGKVGQLNLTYDGQVGFSNLPEDRLKMMSSAEKVQYELDRGNPYGWTTHEADSLKNVNFDWRDVFMQTGVTQQHQISASGGSQASRFYGSLSYMDQEGVVQTTGLKRYTARLSVDNTIKNWRFGVNLSGGFSNITATPEGDTYLSSPLNAMRWSNPYERDKNPNTGDWQQGVSGAGVPNGQLTSGQPNAAMNLFLNYNYSKQVKAVGITYLEFHFPFLKGLYARTNWGIDYAQVEGANYTDRRVAELRQYDGILSRSNNRQLRYTGTTSLHYKKEFGLHTIDVGIFNEVVKNESRNFQFSGFGLNNGFTNEAGITPGSTTNANTIPTVGGGGSQNGLLSYFSLINYGYNDKYFVNLVGRRDGSSRFGLANRFANFGSVGLIWVMNKESFLQNANFVNDLKLRLSYGTNGNNNTATGDFGHIPQLGRVAYNGINGWAPSTPGNLAYRWETNKTVNLGVDFGFFAGKLYGSIDVYDRRTVNLFYTQPVDPSTGFWSVPGNDGELQNKGIEVMLGGDIIKAKDFRWTIEGNLTYNVNKVLSLPEDTVGSGITRLIIGKPLNTFYMVEYAGVNAANGNALYYTLDGELTQQYSIDHARAWGTSISPLFGGITTTFQYKGFELSAQANYFLKRQMFNNERNNLVNPTYFFDNMSREMLREWRNPGDVTDVPRATSAGGNAYQSATTRLLEDGSFWRLRNVSLSYTVPAKAISKLGLRSVRVFAQGQNLLTHTKFQSYDPEFSGAALNGAFYPSFRQVTFGLSVGF